MILTLSRLVILVTFFANCNPDLPAIEQRLKEDRSRPGKVGTLRALEVIHFANKITRSPCKPAIDLDFRGEFKSELSVHLHRRNGKTFRRLTENRILRANEEMTEIRTEKRTIDELGIEHHMKRSWMFDGQSSIITTTLGHGEISGPRPSRSDEKEKMIDAAMSSFQTFRTFSEPKCASSENQVLEKMLGEITIDKSEISDDNVTLNWRAISDGREIEVKYNHKAIAKKVDLVMPSTTGSLNVQTSGFESARTLLEELKKEKLIK